jgi:hypothetical protein
MLLLPALERSELVEAVVAAELVMMVCGTCAASVYQKKIYYSYIHPLCVPCRFSFPFFKMAETVRHWHSMHKSTNASLPARPYGNTADRFKPKDDGLREDRHPDRIKGGHQNWSPENRGGHGSRGGRGGRGVRDDRHSRMGRT